MKILLINLPEPERIGQKRTLQPPIGLWSIREHLQQLSVECIICDMNAGDYERDYLGDNWDAVGISARFSIQHAMYKHVAAMPWKGPIVAGGFHAAAVEKPPGVAMICRHGHGENFFSDLFGLPILPFSELPFPMFAHSEIERIWERGLPHDLASKTARWIPIETSRGCNRQCGFCGVPRYWGAWEGISAEDFADHLDYLRGRHGIGEVMIEDDNVAHIGWRFSRMVKSMAERGIAWSTPNGIPVRAVMRLLPDIVGSSCWRLSLPFETGNPYSAELMGLGSKWVNYPEAAALVGELKAAGIRICGFFIIGYPGEHMREVRQTLDFANGLPLDDRHVYCATPYPGTKLYDDARREGWLKVDGEKLYEQLAYQHALLETPWLRAEEVEAEREADREAAMVRKNNA
ncbi:MAG: radical SAM protein [Chloroflexi bacterium]|nr:radical SAM protein [Chloroflexota bacterium]